MREALKSTTERQAAAIRLHRYLVERHLRGHNLVGPDPGIRLNYRFGRFFKSAVPGLPWNDDMIYLQGQGYWILSNLRLATLHRGTAEHATFADLAKAAAEGIVELQDHDGGWPYPNPEWKGRVANAEGTWAAIGLLAAYRHGGESRFLEAALKWHEYVLAQVGFQRVNATSAVNYFANRTGPRVPNNTAFYLRFLAELADVTGDSGYLGESRALLAFLEDVIKPTGEFPYTVEGETPGRIRDHFQCYQYNAFMALDLFHFARLTAAEAARDLAMRTIHFLETGQNPSGRVAYSCDEHYRTVTYHSAVVAAAFHVAGELGDPRLAGLSARGYDYVVKQQRADGGLPHSLGDYRILADRRSYPRYLTMICYHLLEPASLATDGREAAATEVSNTHV